MLLSTSPVQREALFLIPIVPILKFLPSGALVYPQRSLARTQCVGGFRTTFSESSPVFFPSPVGPFNIFFLFIRGYPARICVIQASLDYCKVSGFPPRSKSVKCAPVGTVFFFTTFFFFTLNVRHCRPLALRPRVASSISFFPFQPPRFWFPTKVFPLLCPF